MTMQTLASKIAKLEGKKSQARIGDIREVLKILVNIMAEDLGADTYAVVETNTNAESFNVLMMSVIKKANKIKEKAAKK